ncbi:MAG: 5,10-methylenetetrahydrofolate reductase [Deltaproteobacteria bacterium RBG_13_61_14]|nr:MAG: 5,10-methylenetetrahydrofolate reductase [Deltaproteobacteria bacterium RBG_13_61_14]
MTERAGSRLERVLAAGHFAVTVEVGPPRGPNAAAVRRKAELLSGVADAYNVTDNQTAVVRMSSIAGARLLLEAGLEPVMQMTVRDRNRIALQSDLLGASALGIKNCLCLSGDHQQASASGKLNGHPGAKHVYDVDSIQLLAILKGLGEQVQESGDPIAEPARFFIGAAWSPLAPPEAFRVLRLAKKVAAGADFIQTQAVYDVPRFAAQVAKAREMGLCDQIAILAGIIVPRSARMLQYLNEKVPGVEVPEELIRRLRAAVNPASEGKMIAQELIEAVRVIPGIRGVHLQAIENEEVLPEIISAAELLPRPVLNIGA